VHIKLNPHNTAVLQALFVTFLWSTSWVLIKIGLQDIPALTFAGLRYFFAFLALIPFYLLSGRAVEIRHLSRRDWVLLTVLGLLFYSLTQGTQFLGLAYLPATTFSLLLNGTALVVAILGILLLRETLSRLQWLGMLVFFTGVAFFFYPFAMPSGSAIGYIIAGISLLATSLSSIIGRGINRQRRLSPLTVTIISMGIGSVVLLSLGLMVEPPPRLDFIGWFIVVWLAIVNTAFAFTLWNLTLRTLSAAESSVINNTMLIQISILAWIFLDESLSGWQIAGLLFATIGTLLVQMRFEKHLQNQAKAH
jgi:drug/metabolite transporter (DMT)-like permease